MIFDSYSINNGEQIAEEIDLVHDHGMDVLKLHNSSQLIVKLNVHGNNIETKLFLDDDCYDLSILGFKGSDKEYSYYDIKEISTSGLFSVEDFVGLDFKLNFSHKPFSLKEKIFDYSTDEVTLSITRYKSEKSYSVTLKCCPVPYEQISKYITKIRTFHSLLRGVMCFESDIVYSTKGGKYIHIYNSRLNDFSVASSYSPDGRLDLIVMKDYIKKYEELWICNTYSKYEPFIHVCEYMQRNDFSNPQMYFKEIFSYLDGFIDIYLSDKEKGISGDNDPKYEKLKSDILDCVKSYDFEVCEKNRIIDNIEMIFDNTIRKSLKVLLGKNRLFNLDKKAREKIIESLINTRNKLFHSPNELFYMKNENSRYLDKDRLVFAVIFIREILINLIYVEVSNQLTCMPLEFVRKGQAGMVERNFLNS